MLEKDSPHKFKKELCKNSKAWVHYSYRRELNSHFKAEEILWLGLCVSFHRFRSITGLLQSGKYVLYVLSSITKHIQDTSAVDKTVPQL